MAVWQAFTHTNYTTNFLNDFLQFKRSLVYLICAEFVQHLCSNTPKNY